MTASPDRSTAGRVGALLGVQALRGPRIRAPRPTITEALGFFWLLLIGLNAGAMLAMTPLGLWGLLIAQVLVIGGGSWYMLRRIGVPWVIGVRLRPARVVPLVLAALIGVAAWLLAAFLDLTVRAGVTDLGAGTPGHFIERFGAWLPILPRLDLGQGFAWQDPSAMLPLLISIVVAAPVLEELAFRGIIARAFERSGARTGVVVTALLFALIHLDVMRLPGVMVMGLVLGVVAYRSGSVLPAIVTHGALNLMGASYSFLLEPLRQGAAGRSAELPIWLALEFPSQQGALVAGGATAATAGLLWLFFRATPRPEAIEPDPPARRPYWKTWGFWVTVVVPLGLGCASLFVLLG